MAEPAPPNGAADPRTVRAGTDVPAAASAAARPHWRSEQLFGPLEEIQIAHGTAVYRLRKTSLGKLILTK